MVQQSEYSVSSQVSRRQSWLRWIIRLLLPAYVGIHAYAYLQVTAAWALAPGIQVLLGLWLVLMILAPFLVRRLELRGYPKGAMATAWIGYTWMGFIFLFFFVSLAVKFLFFMMQAFPGDLVAYSTPGERLTIALGLSVLFSIHGFWRAARPRLVRIPLRSTRLSAGTRLRLVQISDLHIGLLSTPGRLQRIARLIQSAAPDCMVSTGDFTDLRTEQPCTALAHLAALKTPLGKYAVTGNHECYAGLNRSERVLREAGFTLLQQQCVTLDGVVQIAGVDDPAVAKGRPHLEEEALDSANPEIFTVLLKHRPELEPAMIDRIDLQLSGHTHDGQIFPFTLLPRLLYRARPGLTRCGRAALYLSRGTGFWGPPMRFPFPPEVTLFEIEGAR